MEFFMESYLFGRLIEAIKIEKSMLCLEKETP
jgi:hypothetical protein